MKSAKPFQGMILILLAIFIVACAPIEAPEQEAAVQSDKPTAVPVEEINCTPFENPNANLLAEMSFVISEDQTFFENQLLMTGSIDRFEEVLPERLYNAIEWDAVPRVGLSRLYAEGEFDALQFQPGETFGIYLIDYDPNIFSDDERLYDVSSNPHLLVNVIAENILNQLPEDSEGNLILPPNEEPLIPSLNYVIGNPQGVGAHPFASVDVGTTNANFVPQWALGDKGIGLLRNSKTTGDIERTVSETGERQNVLVFDTSPYAEPGTKILPVQVPGGPEAKAICVHHPGLDPNYSGNLTNTIDMPDHGLFVLGLAYAVAPDARYDLIEVLNEKGRGDLFRLLETMAFFIAGNGLSENRLSGTVINLSLGVHSTELASLYAEDIQQMLDLYEILKTLDPTLPPPMTNTQVPVPQLDFLTQLASKQGAIIVAAAGNESDDIVVGTKGLVSSNYPGAYSHVISVAASNAERGRACYSNKGNVAAPGGTGMDTSRSPAQCDAEPMKCEGKGPDCPYGLVSLVLTSTVEPEEYGFSYWTGTSFAAPLISGLAAVGLSMNMDPDDVKMLIASSTCPFADDALEAAGVGIANIQWALRPSESSTCP